MLGLLQLVDTRWIGEHGPTFDYRSYFHYRDFNLWMFRINTGRPSLKLLVYFYISLFTAFLYVIIGIMMFVRGVRVRSARISMFLNCVTRITIEYLLKHQQVRSYLDTSAEQHWYAYRIYAPRAIKVWILTKLVQLKDTGFAGNTCSTDCSDLFPWYCCRCSIQWLRLDMEESVGNIFILFNLIFVLSLVSLLSLGVDLLRLTC